MDFIYFFNSIKKSYTYNKLNFNIKEIFSEPIYIIDNIFIGNIFHFNNYCVIRDYNFKFIINISNHDNIFSKSDLNTLYYNTEVNKTEDILSSENIMLTIDNIISNQTRTNIKSKLQENILIFSDDYEKIICVLYAFLNIKYNMPTKKIKNFLDSKNIFSNQQITL